jgi:hypothetical protein
MPLHRTMLKPDLFGPGPLVEPHFSSNADNSTSGFESWLVCFGKPTAGFPPLDKLARRTPTLSGGLVRWVNIGLATFQVDWLAIRETELRLLDRKLLSLRRI